VTATGEDRHMANDIPTYEHDEPLPEGDGVALPEEMLPGAELNGTVRFRDTTTGATRAGVVVAFERRGDESLVVVRYR
jgi:hypothetical protein